MSCAPRTLSTLEGGLPTEKSPLREIYSAVLPLVIPLFFFAFACMGMGIRDSRIPPFPLRHGYSPSVDDSWSLSVLTDAFFSPTSATPTPTGQSRCHPPAAFIGESGCWPGPVMASYRVHAANKKKRRPPNFLTMAAMIV